VTIRILIADDEELVRTGLQMVLRAEAGLEVVGEARDGEEAVVLAKRLQPDVVLMDIRMPHLDGLEATRRIRESDGPRVVVLTTFDLDEHVFRALRAGASGFLLKDTPAAQLIAAIRAAAAGDALLSPSVTRRLIEAFIGRPEVSVRGRLDELTPREEEVLRLMARGLSNAEIAVELTVGEATIKTHVARVLSKLGVRDRVQAVVAAYEGGMASETS
jgi:DNA-binding NarL/FixJ family response regulator